MKHSPVRWVVQKGLRPAIFDATAGLGGDLSVLANIGCAVLAVERQPVVAALLRDALRRAEGEMLAGVSVCNCGVRIVLI